MNLAIPADVCRSTGGLAVLIMSPLTRLKVIEQ